MDVSNCIFTGPIPDSIFSAPPLRVLYMSNNTLTGTIPTSYAQPQLLKDLWLDGNGLRGSIPSFSAGQLTDLNELLLQFNFFTGSVPQSLCALRGNGGNLDALFTDCGGANPQVICVFPTCCNRCFEGGKNTTKGRKMKEDDILYQGRKRRRRLDLPFKTNRSIVELLGSIL